MATSYTPNTKLAKPAYDDPNPDVPLLATIDRLDTLGPLANFSVTPTEVPSASLNVRVGPGTFRQANGLLATYAGIASQAIAASSTVYLWVTEAGVLATGSAWPSVAHVRLAIVTTSAIAVTTIVDSRVTVAPVGGGHQVRVANATTTYAATLADGMIRVATAGGAFTVTLPDATTCTGQSFRVFKVDASSNVATVAAASGQTINGATTTTITAQYATKSFVSNGTGWDSF